VFTHVGADTDIGELAAHCVHGAAFEALGKNGNRKCRRIGDQEVYVARLAVELDQLGVEVEQTPRMVCSQ
jgi:hypothetical protein